MNDLSPTELEALEVFQEQQWTAVPIPPIGHATNETVIDCKVNDPGYFYRRVGGVFFDFQLVAVHSEQTDDGQWNVRLVFRLIPPHLREPFDAAAESGED